MNVGVPFQPCASIREEDLPVAGASTPAPAVSPPKAPPGNFNRDHCNAPAYPVAPAPASPIRPPGSWGVSTSSVSNTACAAAPKRGETRQVRNGATPNHGE